LNFLCCLLFVDQSAPSKEQLHAQLHSDHLIQTQQETYAVFDCMKYTWGGTPYLRESGNGVNEIIKQGMNKIKKKRFHCAVNTVE
jgi:hypothetical protein